MLISLLTAPEDEPITLELAKEHLVCEDDDDDGLIYELIQAARNHVEKVCNKKLVRQEWRQYFDYGFKECELAPYKVQEVTQIQYIDGDGVTQTLDTSIYEVDIPRQQILLAYGESWPTVRSQRNSWWVDAWSGEYLTSNSPIDITEDIPKSLKSAMLLLIGEMYKNREVTSDIAVHENKTFDALVAPHVYYQSW